MAFIIIEATEGLACAINFRYGRSKKSGTSTRKKKKKKKNSQGTQVVGRTKDERRLAKLYFNFTNNNKEIK